MSAVQFFIAAESSETLIFFQKEVTRLGVREFIDYDLNRKDGS